MNNEKCEKKNSSSWNCLVGNCSADCREGVRHNQRDFLRQKVHSLAIFVDSFSLTSHNNITAVNR
jgi:hypothetical protein